MSKEDKSDQHWNDILDIVNRRNMPSKKCSVTELQGSDMSHDDVILNYISSEVERTQAVDTTSTQNVIKRPMVEGSWYLRLISASKNLLRGVNTGTFSGDALGFAVAGMCLVLLLPIIFGKPINTNESESTISASKTDFIMPAGILEIASDTHKHISFASSQLGLSVSKQSEVYEAFMTGVIHSDISVVSIGNGNEVEEQKNSLLLYHSKNIMQINIDYVNAQSVYDQALSRYGNSDNYSKWLHKGIIVELLYLAASVGLDTRDYSVLASMLVNYGKVTKNTRYEKQTDKYYEEHEQLQMYAKKAANKNISDADVKAIRKHARNIKVRIQ